MTIRTAEVSDFHALLALENASFSGDRLSARQLRHHLGNPRAWLGVVEHDAVLLASVLVLFRADSRRSRLYSIAVAEAARGQGWARRLLEAAQHQAVLRGATLMVLEVRADNASAQALYRSLGYQPFGRREDYYEDGATAIRYCRPL